MTTMTKQELLDYMYKHRDKFIREFADLDEGTDGFDCLVVLVECGMVNADNLPEYGFELNW